MPDPILSTLADIRAAGALIGVGYAEMAAVVAVEARSTGFSGHRLQILYEPHIAWREMTRAKTKMARAMRDRLAEKGLAYRKWGYRRYPGRISARHEQLRHAIKIAGPRAYRWVSMGMGQIMGFNATKAGYRDAKTMFDAFVKGGEPVQLLAMARFIGADPVMKKALQNHNWSGFARAYNGKSYRKNGYHTKLKAAFARAQASATPANAWEDDALGLGDKGPDVAKLQIALIQRGHSVGHNDGDFGPITEAAMREWQEVAGRNVTGTVSVAAFHRITTAKTKPEPPPDTPQGGFSIFKWLTGLFK